MERRLLSRQWVAWNASRLTERLALDHSQEAYRSDTVRNLLVKIERRQTMLKKLSVVAFFAFLSIAIASGNTMDVHPLQDALVELRDNNCVGCHARLSNP